MPFLSLAFALNLTCSLQLSLLPWLRRIWVATVCLGAIATLDAAKDPLVGEEWYHAEWKHITLLSNAPIAKSNAIADSIADFVDSIALTLPFPTRGDRWPLRIVICRDVDTFAALAPDAAKYREIVAGLFTEGLGYDVILLLADASQADLRATLFHELVHREMRATGDLPLWLDEGLAEVFSLFRIRGDKLEYGLSDAVHRHWIQRNGPMPLNRLFQVHHGSPEYNTTPLSQSYYASCWAFTHYGLFGENGSLREAFLAFAEAARRGPIPASAFEHHFGMPMSEMEEQLERYVRGFRFPKGRNTLAGRSEHRVVQWRHDDPHLHATLLAGTLTLSRRFEASAHLLNSLPPATPSTPAATALHNAQRVEQATLAFFLQDFERAHDQARLAYQGGNRSPTTLLLHAEGLLEIQRGQRVRYDLVLPLPVLNLAFRNINRVIEIAPRHALASRLYVLAWLRTNQEPSAAQYRRLIDQVRARPDDAEIAFLTADLMRFHRKSHLERQVLEIFRDHTTLKTARDEAESRLREIP